MRSACLVDTTRCIGCRSCQVACKQSNELAGEHTKFFAAPGGYQNPGRFSPRTFTYVSFHEAEDADGEPAWTFVKHQCMHCTDLYCARVCPADCFRKTATGVVAYEAGDCIGCAACVDACPFDVPAIDYGDLAAPHIRKCTFCLTRQDGEKGVGSLLPERPGGCFAQKTPDPFFASFRTPACAKACPADCLQFGDRDDLLKEAKRRVAMAPERYVNHVYGETEAGGTGWLYLARAPFEKLGFPASFENLDMYEKVDLGSRRRSLNVPHKMRAPCVHPAGQVVAAPDSLRNGFGALAAGVCWFFKRRDAVQAAETDSAERSS